MVNEASYHVVISLDVQDSASHRNSEKLDMRTALYEAVRTAAAYAGVDPRAWHQEDRGDGQLIVLPTTTPRSRLLGRWLERLDTELRAYNTGRPGRARVRVRVGIHGGEVHRDDHGVAGTDVDIACRLAGLPIVKATLREASSADLIIVVSDPIYQSVVRPGGEFLDPKTYAEVRADLAEWHTTAWVRVPGHASPPFPVTGPDDRAAEPHHGPEPVAGAGAGVGAKPPATPAAKYHIDMHDNDIKKNRVGDTYKYERPR